MTFFESQKQLDDTLEEKIKNAPAIKNQTLLQKQLTKKINNQATTTNPNFQNK